MEDRTDNSWGDSKFVNSNNVYLLRGLFLETSNSPDTVVYTLKNKPHQGYPSLYEAYMDSDDPTEYTFAVNYLESWDHWQVLSGSAWFQPYAEKWRKDLEARTRSRAIKTIITKASDGSRESLSAAKYIAEILGTKKRGRPSAQEVKQAATDMAKQDRHTEDFIRLVGSSLSSDRNKDVG